MYKLYNYWCIDYVQLLMYKLCTIIDVYIMYNYWWINYIIIDVNCKKFNFWFPWNIDVAFNKSFLGNYNKNFISTIDF